MNRFKKLFSKETDKAVKDILDEAVAKNHETAQQAKSLTELLKKNGVTLQIVVATGGDRGHK